MSVKPATENRPPPVAGREPLRVTIAGGGTGGHLYPGIAVARELLARRPEARISFAGTIRGIEARVLPREGFPLDLIRSGGVKGKSLIARAKGLGLVPLGLFDAWRLLSRRRPDVVIGVGGYSSGPVVLVAALRRIPTIVLEQNAVPGVTNRLLAPFVGAAAVTFDSTRAFFGAKAFVSGNPVRRELMAAAGQREPPDGRSWEDGIRVLVFGGSQGAHAINVAMVEAAAGLAAERPPLRLTHQTGDRDEAMVRLAYRQVGLSAEVAPYWHDMGRRLAETDLVVCRAGATTVAEISAAGRAAILIPLPTATDDHQRQNAEALARAGAAHVLLQRDLSGAVLAGQIVRLARDHEGRERMAKAAATLARPDAARVVVDRVLALAEA